MASARTSIRARRFLALALAIGLVGAGVGVALARSSGPTIKLAGNSFTTVVDGPTTVARFEFAFDAKVQSGNTSGSLAWKAFGCLNDQGAYDGECLGSDPTLHQVGFFDVTVSCLVADKPSHTIWFSGKVQRGLDLTVPAQTELQEQDVIKAGEIMVGRLQDTDNDGTADVRSLFSWVAGKPYPNALTTNELVTSPWYTNGLGAITASNACKTKDGMFVSADYMVADGPTNQIQWLDGTTSAPVGVPITGSAANLAAPPALAVYNFGVFTRDLGSESLLMTIR